MLNSKRLCIFLCIEVLYNSVTVKEVSYMSYFTAAEQDSDAPLQLSTAEETHSPLRLQTLNISQ